MPTYMTYFLVYHLISLKYIKLQQPNNSATDSGPQKEMENTELDCEQQGIKETKQSWVEAEKKQKGEDCSACRNVV